MTPKTDIEKLREIAIDQHGMITAAQAKEAGVSLPSLSYLVKHQRIDRLERGIYRIPQVNPSANDRIAQALLWAGEDAVLSHDTALMAWNVCDINPTTIHVTIPKERRIQKPKHQSIEIHKDNIEKSLIKWWDGMPTVSLELAIGQSIDRGVSSHIIEQAIQVGTSRGMINDAKKKELCERLERRG